MSSFTEILRNAGFMVPDLDPDWCDAHFIPDREPVPQIDFEELAQAQRHYREVLELQAGVMPFHEWLPQRLPEVSPESYWQYIDALRAIANRLERRFGVDLLMAPSLDEQQERPQ